MSEDASKKNSTAAVFCSECGTKNDDVAKFCISCGKPLTTRPGSGAADTQPASLPPDVSPTFAPPVSVFTGPVAELIAQRMLLPPSRPGLLAVLDHFEILRVLGGGGMGIVLLARDSDTGRDAAIKLVKSDLVANQHVVHRFLKEAGHLKRLRHTNIVPVHEISDRSEGPYFVMPYFEKGSLASRIKPGQPMDTESILDIAAQVAEGLSFAHRNGIIHRDLKPANILLMADGRACLADFGLARTMFNDTIVDVESRQLEGTAPYMSPAVAAGDAEDTRCDIYSFGALLYEMLTGQPPYKGRGTKEILDQIIAGPPKPISGLNPNADRGLIAVAEGCMARELRDRYADMRDVLKDLERIKENKQPTGQRGFKKAGNKPSQIRHVLKVIWIPACLAGIVALIWLLLPTVRSRPFTLTLPPNWNSLAVIETGMATNIIYLGGSGTNGGTFGEFKTDKNTFTDLSKILPSSWARVKTLVRGEDQLIAGGDSYVRSPPVPQLFGNNQVLLGEALHGGRLGTYLPVSGSFQDLSPKLRSLNPNSYYYGLGAVAFNGREFLIGGAGVVTSLGIYSPATGAYIPLNSEIPFYFAVNTITLAESSFLIAGAGAGPGPGQPPALGWISPNSNFKNLTGLLPNGWGATWHSAYDGTELLLYGSDRATGTNQMLALLNPSTQLFTDVTGSFPTSFKLHSIASGNGYFIVGGQLNDNAFLARYSPGVPLTNLTSLLPRGALDLTAINIGKSQGIFGGSGQGNRVFLTIVSNNLLAVDLPVSQSSAPFSAPSYVTNAILKQSVTSITTLAGKVGVGGYADGTGNQAQFHLPNNAAVDKTGNVYVADTANNAIRKITPNGIVTTLAGVAGSHGSTDGIGSNARFWAPFGIAVDRAGNVYVADTANNTIRKITPNGVVSTLAGFAGHPGSNDSTGVSARFRNPWSVAVDGMGNVFVADMSNDTIRKITPTGVVTTVAGQAGMNGSAVGFGNNARFNGPFAVAVDNADNVYVSDSGNNTIRKIMPSRVVVTLAGLPGYVGSTDGNGNDARFCNPQGLTVDGAGNVYVADTGNNTIRKITPMGVVTTLPGLVGDTARFNSPGGVAVDITGNVYVADTNNHCIRKIVLSQSAGR